LLVLERGARPDPGHAPEGRTVPDTRKLAPAAQLAGKASKPFPNESPIYRSARTALLTEEIELRRHIERVAAQRRALPLGGEVTEDYAFEDAEGKRTRLSEIFGRHVTLVTYFWMFGPERERPCPMCTNFLGPMDANAPDIEQNVALAVIGRSPVARQLAFARERGWRHLRMFGCAGTRFAEDYRGMVGGEETAALNVFVKRDGRVHLFYAGEMNFDTVDPGQDPRGAPDFAPLWNTLDLTPQGRRPDWYPKLSY
jgi:predicted dithiol-disulfide oxidoreductase (DUF899 family)